MDDQETRNAYHQIVLDRQELARRTQKIGDSSDSESDSDSEMDIETMRNTAINKMREALD